MITQDFADAGPGPLLGTGGGEHGESARWAPWVGGGVRGQEEAGQLEDHKYWGD